MSKKKNTSGKYESRKSGKKPLFIVIAVILLAAVAAMAMLLRADKNPTPAAPSSAADTAAAEATVQTTAMADQGINLGYGLYLTDVGSYTGLYMEDGSDEVLSNILMMVVKNNGESDIQYATVTMDLGAQQAQFTITTLPVGESVVLLDTSRLTWDDEIDYEAILPKVESIAYFQEPISLHEDKLKIQIIDGALNVTNISGEDIPGTLKVYYKNAAQDLLYGGITYQITIEGGLKAEEIRQVMTKHASDTGSRIMFATIAP